MKSKTRAKPADTDALVPVSQIPRLMVSEGSAEPTDPDEIEQQANSAYVQRQVKWSMRQQARAQRAYDAFAVPWPALDEFPAGTDYDHDRATRSKTAHRDMLQAALAKYLNADSLPFFAELIARDREELARIRQAKGAADERYKNDPKQAAKAQVRPRWNVWQTNRGDLKRTTQFAKSMCKLFPVLDSQATIERWCREWSSEKQVRLLWDDWQLYPATWPDTHAFAAAMLKKFKPLKDPLDIENWCQVWSREAK